MFQRGVSLLFATVVCLVASGCATEATDASYTEEELAELDTWAETNDGKADLPAAWNDLVEAVRKFYMEDMSAIRNNEEHPANATAAIARTRQLLAQAGITDPTGVYFPTTVQRLRAKYFDHSEVDVVLAPGKVLRLLGDPHGAGVYVDSATFEDTIGTPLCLNWTELQAAIRASYREGIYGVDYVCHTVTEVILRELDIGSRSYANQIRTYKAALWIWGPLLPNWSSRDPRDWAVARACPAR